MQSPVCTAHFEPFMCQGRSALEGVCGGLEAAFRVLNVVSSWPPLSCLPREGGAAILSVIFITSFSVFVHIPEKLVIVCVRLLAYVFICMSVFCPCLTCFCHIARLCLSSPVAGVTLHACRFTVGLCAALHHKASPHRRKVITIKCTERIHRKFVKL